MTWSRKEPRELEVCRFQKTFPLNTEECVVEKERSVYDRISVLSKVLSIRSKVASWKTRNV